MRSQLGGVSATSALAILLLLGLVLRLAIAYVLFPSSGFGSDIGTFTSWALAMVAHGPGDFYANVGFADYPPGYLYVLWLIGGLGHLLAPLANGDPGAVTAALIKVPPMLADIVVGGVLFSIVRRWAGDRTDGARLGLLAAGIYVFNPVTWYDSALWGQTDAVGALVVLLAVAALVRGNSEGAAALTILAALVKPQFGIVLAPLAAGVLLHRHVLRPGSGPAHRPLVPERLATVREWFEQERGPWRLVSSATASLLVLLALLFPFGLDLPGFFELMAGTAGGYPYLSVNAYNPWALIGSEGRSALADGGGWSPDLVPLFGPLPGVFVGAALLFGGFLLGWLRLLWQTDRRTIVVAGILLALAFFVLPTRVHERYMFPIFGLLPLLAVVDRRWLWATVALSAAAFINMHGVLTTPLYATPNIANLPLGELFRQPLGIYASVVLNTAGFVFVAWQLLPRQARQPDPWHDAATDRSAVAGQEGGTAGGVPEATLATAPPGRRSTAAPRISGRLGRLLAVVPLRRDRSAELAAERGGRLDRKDLVALALVFMAALGLRGFNLAQPYGMHFDEVYHARTGTEFLQHWRYGMPHSIYEYTHPHLAKYAMALGIDVLGNNRVTSTTELGTSVRSAALERRWDEEGGARRGDRAYLVTGNGVRVLDLATRQQVTSMTMFVEAVAVDEGSHTLYLADSAGGLWQLPTPALDALRADPNAPAQVMPQQLGRLDLPGRPLELFAGEGRLIVLAEGDLLVAVDPLSGVELARTTVRGAAAVVPVATEADSALAVAASEGIVLLDAETLGLIRSYATEAPVTGMTLVQEGADRPTIYAASGGAVQLMRVPGDEEPQLGERLTMPGPVRDVFANPSAALVHVLGMTPDGDSSTLYVIEPHSNAVFADAVLPFAPQQVLMDVQPRRPANDRLDALALSSTGSMATVDVGGNTFGWRFPGVLAGALMAVAMYLLARFLFQRRSVAVIAALIVLADGMAFANSRIAMNDTYVALFITAAFALFAPLYVGRWRSPPAVAAGIIGVGLLIGLALASKWVGAYALGGIVLLILLRSALGRIMALIAMIGMTALLGYIAISPGAEATQLNFLFLGLMVVLTAVLAVAITVRPLPLTADERRLAVLGPAVLAGAALAAGLGLMIAGGPAQPDALLTPGRALLVALAMAWLAALAALVLTASGRRMLAVVVARIGWQRAARWLRSRAEGLAALEEASADLPPDGQAGAGMAVISAAPPRGWLRPGSGVLGLPWLATMATLAAVPLLVYVLSYAPWVELGNRWTTDLPAGHTGQTFADLQKGMYDYHNNLRATHAASSPWWAWPLDLKPVWFYQRDFAGGTTGSIYNTGNMVLFWLSIPAVAFAAFMAWRRRSLALALIVIGVASLWLPWARIDRATFQYHVFTAMPFAFLCLAYLLAELWHGPSRRTWAFARLAGAWAILLAPLLWVLRLPLCALARVDQVNASAEACQLGLGRSLALSDLQVLGFVALVAGAALLGWLAWQLRRPPMEAPAGQQRSWLTALGMILLGGGMVVVLGGAFLPGPRTFELPFGGLLPLLWLVAPLIMLALLAVPAYYVLRARDARRFTVGALLVAGLWFLIWYPNISGLPVPTLIIQAYQVVLPTLNYSFQFGVNTDPPGGQVSLVGVAMLGAVVTMLVLAAIYAARSWRAAPDEPALRPAEEPG